MQGYWGRGLEGGKVRVAGWVDPLADWTEDGAWDRPLAVRLDPNPLEVGLPQSPWICASFYTVADPSAGEAAMQHG